MSNLLAQALGRIAARQGLVSKIVLPSSLPRSFLHDVSAAAAQFDECCSFVVARNPEDEEIGAGTAIRYRSPADPSIRSVVLVSTIGDMKDLKSLETNTDLLSGGLPGGVRLNDDAYISISLIAVEIAIILKETGQYSAAIIDPLKSTLKSVFSFLGDSYQEVGNAGIEWIDGYWQHLASLTAALPELLLDAAESLTFAERAAFTAAGLPLPDSPAGYDARRHTPKRFAQVLERKWSDRSRAINTASEIALKAGEDHHPLTALNWNEYPLSIGRYLHPVLALSQHGIGDVASPSEAWRAAWQSTTEEQFFGNIEVGEIEVECEVETYEGDWEPLAPFPAMDASFVLPISPNMVKDNSLQIGRVRIRLVAADAVTSHQGPAMSISIAPKSAFKVGEVSASKVESEIHVTFELSKAVTSKSKWPEKFIKLSITGENAAATTFLGGKRLALKLLVPNPARPSCFVVDASARKITKTYHHSDTRLMLDETSTLLVSEVEANDLEINLPASVKQPVLACFNVDGAVQWEAGRTPSLFSEKHGVPAMHLINLNPIPEDNRLDVAGHPVLISKDEVVAGQLSPIHAAFSGDQVCAPTDDELRVLDMDPRWNLESWLAHECIEKLPSDQFMQALGSCVLSTSEQYGEVSVTWNAASSMSSNLPELAKLLATFPSVDDDLVKRFSDAFRGLNLGACQQSFPDGAKPGFLDLTNVSKAAVEEYLKAYAELLVSCASGANDQLGSWPAYPFSALLLDAETGRLEGALLSPLHPIRLAWAWSAQFSATDIRSNEAFASASATFMRFIDGESFPLVGPSPQSNIEYLQFTNTSLGPREFFAGWGLLASGKLDTRMLGEGVKLFGKRLPLGSISGLSNGGISASVKDYLRNYPLTPQLRIEVSGKENAERVASTDEAVVDAASRVLAQVGANLPGGITVFENTRRRGEHPNARYVLSRIEASQKLAGLPPPLPQFEWIVSDSPGPVDLLLLEESPVQIDVAVDDDVFPGTTGPSLPISRYKTWPVPDGADPTRSVTWLPSSPDSYSQLPAFRVALDDLEELARGGKSKLQCQVNLGANVGLGRAMWAITGNRHLNPSALTARLAQVDTGYMMWEWRPAFLGREEKNRQSSQLSTSHPYTVLARPSIGLKRQLGSLLGLLGIDNLDDCKDDITRTLGARGVGLSSLLSMGHKQSLGAIGFYLAFKVLADWETSAPNGTIRCIIPLDACFPFIDAMAAAKESELESNQRADLLLLEAKLEGGGDPELVFHPIEIKARTHSDEQFPERSSKEVKEALSQLDNTLKVVKRFQKNWKISNGARVLVNSAFAALLEACLALKPAGAGKDANLEINLIEAVANGRGIVRCSSGTLLYFLAQGRARNGAPVEPRLGGEDRAGQLMCSMAEAVPVEGISPVARKVTDLVLSSWPHAEDGSLQTDALASDVTQSEDSNNSDSVEDPNQGPRIDDRANDLGSGAGFTAEAFDVSDNENKPDEDGNRNDTLKIQESGISVQVGTVGKSKPVTYNPSDTQLTQLNVGVVGDLGTGKTQFLQSFVCQLVSSEEVNRGVKPKVFIFDFKDDYSVEKFRSSINAKVLDPTGTLPVNFFHLDESAAEQDKVRRAIFFSSTLDTIVGIGPVQQNRLMNAVMEAYASCAPGYYPMLPDVLDIYKNGVDGKPDKVISVLEKLVLFRVFETDPAKVIGFREFFDRSIVLNLTTLAAAGQQLADVVVSIFLDHLYFDYMKNVQKPGFVTGADGVKRRVVDTMVLIDEAHHAMSKGYDVLMKLLLEGREFGLGVVLSSQYLKHFRHNKQDWAEPLSTWIVHKVRGTTAKDFERIGFPGRSTLNLADRVSQLEPHWAYYRCDHGNQEGVLMRGLPFFELDIDET